MHIDGYKCPNCGGTVKFDSSAQQMKCPYCDAEFEIAALEEHQKEINASAKDEFAWNAQPESSAWDGAETDDLAAGNCPSCGAELFGNENTVAAVCPCCGNAQIVIKRLCGTLKPDYVIPFKLEKKAAVDAMKEFCKKKRLLPKFFTQENHVESMQGIYVPFWLFDADANGHVRFKAAKTSTRGSGKNTYTEVKHYSVIRDGSLAFEKIPVDGSEKMDDAYMDAIEPFHYNEMKEFNKAFLAGYVAERYDVDAEKSKARAEERIKSSLVKEFKDTVKGYTTVTVESSAINVKNGKVSYGLFPVWVLNTKYNNENYQFMMNGQTGRLVGKLPVDKGKSWGYMGGISAIFGALLSLFAFMGGAEALDLQMPLAMAIAWCLSVVGGISVVQFWTYQMNTARQKTEAGQYIKPGSLSITRKDEKFLYKSGGRSGSGIAAAGTLGAAIGVASALSKMRK
ncbi:MAG: hypothetical protein FWB85_10220 [Chitinispirillia bacterium]|nr:hypothetical protein [Chitinispirillia bacterium]MCL2242582.1 hypothetical protein [Chitinispirillia bacterium]